MWSFQTQFVHKWRLRGLYTIVYKYLAIWMLKFWDAHISVLHYTCRENVVNESGSMHFCIFFLAQYALLFCKKDWQASVQILGFVDHHNPICWSSLTLILYFAVLLHRYAPSIWLTNLDRLSQAKEHQRMQSWPFQAKEEYGIVISWTKEMASLFSFGENTGLPTNCL